MKHQIAMPIFAFLVSLLASCSKQSHASASLVKFTPPEHRQISLEELGPRTSSAPGTNLPAGAIVFRNTRLSQVLDVYSVLANAQLMIDPRLQSLPTTVTFSNHQELTQAEAVGFIEQELHEQAGLAFEHQDARHVAIRPGTDSAEK
jgi:hypothetical protein